MSYALPIALAVGGMVTAGMQAGAGEAQAKALKRQGEWNAQVMEQQASMIQEKKKIEEYQYNRAAAKMRGAVAARAGASGLMLSGSPLAVMVDNETQLQMDKAIGQYNLEVESQYARSGATYYRDTAAEQSRLARMTGYTNAFSTMLGTATSIGMMKYPTKAKTPGKS